ncbi:MAG: putative lipid II flippase FtsW [Propionibacteriaceae bacterium]|nr:putative lipid II flippase FtsW [Propionibacteriaceae bacterium]
MAEMAASPAANTLKSRTLELLDHPFAHRFLVLGSSILLTVIGLIMVASASSVEGIERWEGDAWHYSFRQMLFAIAGVVGAVFCYWLFTTRSSKTLRVLGYIAMLACLALELATFIPGLGFEMGGNRNWLKLVGDQRIQPAELGKLAIIWWGAAVFALKGQIKGGKLLRQPIHILFPFVITTVLFTALVVIQGDVGTGIILIILMMLMLWEIGAPIRVMLLLLAPMAAGAAFYILTSANRRARVMAFFNPGTDVAGANYQQTQAQMAFARGGWFGVGLQASRQKWLGLPEAHTDYILAVTGEELGLVMVLAIIALFAVLGFAGFQISIRSDIAFYKYASAGVTGWIVISAAINIAVELGLLPVFGIPLPFLSSGGSSLVATLCGVGILMAAAAKLPQARNVKSRGKVKVYQA